MYSSGIMGAKVHNQEGNSPDRKLRSLITQSKVVKQRAI